MTKTPIINTIKNYLQGNTISFHTPGHKGGKIVPASLRAAWNSKVWNWDLTEIENLDNLHCPLGCIKEAQEKIAILLGAKSSYLLVNGCSVGLHAAIMALCRNAFVFVPRHVHKSIYNGMILADANPVYLPVSLDKETGIPLGIEPDILQEFIKKYPECKRIIIPSPTYQGIIYKLEENIAVAKRNGLQVIIDEAHGAHFSFHDKLPLSGLALGCDIIVQSWHKTLPVLTQAAILHLGKNYSGPDISQYLNMLQTTSPSYLLMASLDACRAFMEEEGKGMLANSLKKILGFRENLKGLKHIFTEINTQEKKDPFKLLLYSKKISGEKIAEFLKKGYGFIPELTEGNYCLLLFGIEVSERMLISLTKVLYELDKELSALSESKYSFLDLEENLPEKVISIKEAFWAEKTKIPAAKAVNRIVGEYIIKYPPGIPLVVPGEKLSQKIIEKSCREFITVVKE